MKKNEAKIIKSPIFDLQKRNIPQKKPQDNRQSYLKQNKRIFYEKIETKSISRFLLQKNCNFSSVSAKFLKNLYR